MAQFRPDKNGTGLGIVYIEKANLNPGSIEGKALTLFRVEGWWKNSADFVLAEFRTKTALQGGIGHAELVRQAEWINNNR